MDFSITATVVLEVGNTSTTTQVPAFVLKGMASEDHAVEVAKEIINPVRNPALKVFVSTAAI